MKTSEEELFFIILLYYIERIKDINRIHRQHKKEGLTWEGGGIEGGQGEERGVGVEKGA
jgi:hypothetical protein